MKTGRMVIGTAAPTDFVSPVIARPDAKPGIAHPGSSQKDRSPDARISSGACPFFGSPGIATDLFSALREDIPGPFKATPPHPSAGPDSHRKSPRLQTGMPAGDQPW